LIHPDLDPGIAQSLRGVSPEDLWERASATVSGGRGSVRRLKVGEREYLLKRERRGGLLGKILPDGFFTRSPFLEEWELSLILSREGLTPPIIARWFIRKGLLFGVFSLVEPLPRSASLVSLWKGGGLDPDVVRSAGVCVGSLHKRGVRHGDLNAGNLLAMPEGGVVAIDWRRSHIDDPLSEKVRRANLLRLARSLHKVQHLHLLPWPEGTWERLAEGYGEGYGAKEPWLETFPAQAARGFTWRRLLWPLSGK
jgi:3-deoxy-D-manno-octulosonic acid kinase